MANSYSGLPVRAPAFRAVMRKLLILYLTATTGCASTVQTVGQTSSVQSTLGGTSAAAVTTSSAKGTAAPDLQNPAGNRYNLPELASASTDTEPTKEKANPLLEGVGAPSDQQLVANPFNKDGQGKDFGEFQGLAMGLANSAGSQAIKDWFASKKATAQLSMGAGESGVRFGSFDVLMPFYDTPKDLIFTQAGFRRSNISTEDYRNTVNVGVGYRHTVEDVLYGVNAFYDRDMTGKNDRLGLGAEVWTDSVKFSGNTYLRLSDWKKSPDMEYYQERPANGWDIRAEGYLPQYPQLGGKLMYEQYYGNEVGLFGASSRQKDPSATTVGVIYTPIPLITMSADYRQGQDGLSDTTVRVGLNYQIGSDLSKQLSPDEVKASRMLGNARYNLVDRKYDIVLDYKKDEVGQIILPAQMRGTPGSTLSFPVTVNGKNIHNVSWTGTAGNFARPYGGGNLSTLVLPASETVINSYTLQAVGTDSFGRVIQSNIMQIGVDSYKIAIERSKPVAMADGADPVTFTATLQETSGTPVANAAIEWGIEGGATAQDQDAKTDSKGQARVTLVSKARATVQVTAKEPLGAQAQIGAQFGADLASARVVGLVATPASVVADGIAVSTLVATVQDASGNSIGPGATITWITSLGELSAASSVTDENGKATVTLTGKVVGDASVTATAVKGGNTAKVTFTANVSTAKVIGLVATPTSITANGTDSSTLVATVQDASGNPVGAGVEVKWSTSTGKLSSASSVTDASGKATATLTGTTAGNATVTAKAAAGESTATVALVADGSTGKVIGLVATPTSITANGTDSSTLVATVQDAHGNPVGAGVTVNWFSNIGKVSSASSVTDTSGKATVMLTGTKAGTATVKASAAAGDATATVQLNADLTTARVVTVTGSPSTIAANVEYGVELVAMVQDANGNPVGAGVTVTWSSTPRGDLMQTTTQTDESGKAVNRFGGSTAGPYTITASASGGSASTTITVTANLNRATVTTLVATPISVVADGSAVSVLVATIKDGSDNPVGPGVTVTWSTDFGSLSGTSTVTDSNSQAIVTLSSADLGSATVTARAIAGAKTARVTFIPDPSTAQVVTLTSPRAEVVAAGIDSELFTATVKDARGHLVGGGVQVNWRNSDSRGTMSAATSLTDANSQATMRLTSPLKYGSTTITAEAVKGSKSKDLVFISDVTTARILNIDVSPLYIVADGVDKTTFYANLTDANGNGFSSSITPLVVTWTTDFGTLSGSTSVSSNSSQASITLTGNAVGVANVTASVTATGSGLSTKSTRVTLTADNRTARVTSLTASPTTIRANGLAYTDITATVRDVRGNLAASVQVPWTTNLGTLSSASGWTDANGRVTTRLTGTVSGTATVTANAVAGGQSTNVILTD